MNKLPVPILLCTLLFSIVALATSLRARVSLSGDNHAIEIAKIANEKATCTAWGQGYGKDAPDTAICEIGESTVFVTAGVGFPPRLECVSGACAKQLQAKATGPGQGPSPVANTPPAPAPQPAPAPGPGQP